MIPPLGDSKHGTAISTTGPEPDGGWTSATVIELPQIVTWVPIAAAFGAHAPLPIETKKPSPIREPNLKSIETSLRSSTAFFELRGCEQSHHDPQPCSRSELDGRTFASVN